MITNPLPPRTGRLSAAAFLAAALVLGCTPGRTSAGGAIGATAVTLDARDEARTRFGALELLAGFALTLADPGFGGYSGLSITEDGSRLTAISDRAGWLELGLSHDAEARLVGFGAATTGSLRDIAGTALRDQGGDAEALARLAGGGFAVSFERRPRIDAYPEGLDARAVPLVGTASFGPLPMNGGLEAMTALADGRLIALVEAAGPDGVHQGFLIGPEGISPLAYRTEAEFSPTDVAELRNGDLLVLERKFNVVEGVHARLVRITAANVRAGAVLEGRELARLSPPLATDNFEGLAVRPAPGGGTLVYVISDDNFKPFQRTLIYQFLLDD
ncbi:MAG: esterase-like activity of phytase family protein [Alphaproteobacteria bacterium]